MKKKKLIIFLFIILAMFSLYLYTNSLTITYHEKTFGHSNRKLTIAHVTDLHSNNIGRLEKNLFKALHEKKPDVIFITGDLAPPGGNQIDTT